MTVIYLLHFRQSGVHHGHYLGLADAEASIRTDMIRQGAGWRGLAPGTAMIADVWEAESLPVAEALYARLKRQGGRSRICSICSPGNSRGAGTGNWRASKQAQEASTP